MIEINGRVYQGNNLSMIGGKILIDGVDVTDENDSKEINVTIYGNLENLEVGHANKIEVVGNVHKVHSSSGKIEVKGVSGNVSTLSGSISSADIVGNVDTVSGSVKCGNIEGSVETISGSIRHK